MNTVYLSALAAKPLMEYLTGQGLSVHLLDGTDTPVYHAVSTHADIHMCRLGLWENARLFMGNPMRLQQDYPGNIRYNAVCTGKYFLHNLKYTDPELLQAAKDWHREFHPGDGLQFVNVRQGYTRCCCLPVEDDGFITSDGGIAKVLLSHGAKVLQIRPGHIALPGFDCGFIGGCAGHLPPRTMVFNGDLSTHPDYEKIAVFLKDRDIDLLYFTGSPLTDIGSILLDG